jgi:glycosyltransferase involved in cell wall biosynthesis
MGHEIHVVTYHLGDREIEVQIPVHRIRPVGTYKKLSPGPSYQKLLFLDPLLAKKLLEVLRNNKIDLIHAHHYEGLIVSAFVRRWTKHPLIFDAHTLLESELAYYGLGLSARLKRTIGRHLDKRLPKWPDHVIAVTERIRNKLVHDIGLPEEKVTVISDGVEREVFFADDRPGRSPRTEGPRHLVFAGNLAAYQRIDLLLKAFREVAMKKDNVRLLMVTDSSFEAYEPLARQLGIRGLLDIVHSRFEDLPGHLAGAEIALNPRTECDGIPLKLLNYMAVGKPVVSYEGSASCLEHGRTGWIVKNGDISAFAGAVLRLLDDRELASTLGENARQEALLNHTWDKKARETEAVYRRLLARGTRA